MSKICHGPVFCFEQIVLLKKVLGPAKSHEKALKSAFSRINLKWCALMCVGPVLLQIKHVKKIIKFSGRPHVGLCVNVHISCYDEIFGKYCKFPISIPNFSRRSSNSSKNSPTGTNWSRCTGIKIIICLLSNGIFTTLCSKEWKSLLTSCLPTIEPFNKVPTPPTRSFSLFFVFLCSKT